MKSLSTIATALEALHRQTGIPVIWKTITMWHIHHADFTEGLYHHCTPFCMSVKAACSADCCAQESGGLLAATAEHEHGTFVKCCHAGVVEVVVPVVADGHIQGFLCAGPFRRPDAAYPHAGSTEDYAKLPTWEQADYCGLTALLEVFSAGLVELHPLRSAIAVADPRIRQAIAYLHRYFDQPLRAADLAACCSISESRFIHLFTSETGLSFSNYLIALRIEEAKRLLADPRLSKAEVALATGFSDQSHFSATFRKRTGLTPGQFQVQLKRETESLGITPGHGRWM